MSGDVYSYSKKSGDRKGRADKAFDWKDTKPKFHKFDKEDDFSLAIIPHVIKSKNHPMVRAGFKPGDEAYMMDFWVHSDVGPSKARVICPNQTWGKPCPICEEQERMSRNKGWDSKEAKALKAKHRVIYNIVVGAERDGDLVLFETSFALFEDELRNIAESKGRRKGGKIIPYGTLSEGVEILFSTEKDKVGKNEFLRYTAFDFETMKKPLPASMIDEAIDPSEFMIKLHYDDIMALLEGDGEDDEDEDEDDEPKKPSRRSRDDDDDEPKKPRRGRNEDDEDEAPKSKRRSNDDDDADEPEEPQARRSREDDEEDETKKPTRKSRDEDDGEPKARRSRDDDDEPKSRRSRGDDEDAAPKKARSRDDDDDEEERPRRGGRESASEDSRPRRRD